MPTNRCYLQWYRDKGRGQEAATALGAEELVDFWPIARWYGTNAECSAKWQWLLDTFQVNAMTVYPADYQGSYVNDVSE